MTEAKWLKMYFNQSSAAIMIFQDDHLVKSNAAAQQLVKKYHLSPGYLLQIVKNQWRQDEAQRLTATAVTLPVAKGHLHLSLFYRGLDPDQGVYALTAENHQQQQHVSSIEHQHLLNRYLNRAHEKERQRISQDLHDSIAQGVYSAIMGVRRIAQDQLSAQQVQTTSQTIEMQLQQTLAEIKAMALGIRPAVLDSFGLVPAIKALAKRLQANSGVTINVLATDKSNIHLSQDGQNVLYRVCQEAINNALRHAQPSEINVLVSNHPHFVQMQVLDDGSGFDLSQYGGFNGHSLGLMNMKERVTALNGFFKISSHPNEGTTVTVKFPFNK